ncbi:MAG: DUF3987 domain-containing protein [Candidatus Caenarcaniphilales bacterium]|nr:DUF3987 domain-containing protein [Candidatus Caenarcaniphilales bacterium]
MILNVKHTESLKNSGLSLETIQKCAYRSVSDGWEVDFPDPFTGEIKLTIKRLDNPIDGMPKYLQPKDTKPYPYFSKLVDWNSVFKDKNTSIIITEGTKKADCANQNGFITVALQGIYGWSCKKKLIDQMKWVLTKGRTIYICFDSDQLEKEQVKNAVIALAKEAYRSGCNVRTIDLPRYTKGIDDYFMHYKETAKEGFKQLINAANNPVKDIFLSYEDIRTRVNYQDLDLELDYTKLPRQLLNFHQWTKDSTHAPDNLITFGLIGTVSSALGKQVAIEAPSKRLYPNIWGCGIASSGTGKTTALNISLDFLYEINLEQVNMLIKEQKTYKQLLKLSEDTLEEIPEMPRIRVPILPSITSKEKLYENLANGDGSGVVATSEELSTMLEDINNDRNAGYKPLLISLYGGSKAAPLMSFKNSDTLPPIKEPAVSIMGVSTLGSFFKSFQYNDFFSGLLQRFFFVLGNNKPKLAFPPKRSEKERIYYQTYIKQLFNIGNDSKPMIHTLSQEAKKYWVEIYNSLDSEFGYMNDEAVMSCFSRYNDELIFKIALIFHYLEDTAKPTSEVSKDKLEEAVYYVSFLKRCLLYILKEKQMSQVKHISSKIIDKLNNQDNNSLTVKKLKDSLGAYRSSNQSNYFDEALEFLLEKGVIEMKEIPNGSNNDTVSQIIYLMIKN